MVDNQYAAGHKAPVLVSSAVAGVVAGVITAQVPELRDGKLQIVNIARIPGKSTKIIVKANDPEVNVREMCLGVNYERIDRVKLVCTTPGRALVAHEQRWSRNQYLKTNS